MQATALNVLFEGFLLSREANGASKGTLDAYRFMFKHLCQNLPTSAIRDPGTITTEDIQRWSVSMASYANATRDQRIAKAKAFFNWLVKEGFLESNPIGKVKRPKKNWQPDPLSDEEVIMLLQEAKHGRASVRNYAIVCVLLDSGIRNTELCKLKVEDVSIKTGELKIHDGKGGKERTVLIGKRAKDALWRWLMQRLAEARYLFCTEQGQEIGRDRMCVIVRNIGKRVGIKVYPHRLRPHLCADVPEGWRRPLHAPVSARP